VTAQFGPSAGFQAQYDPFEVGKFFAQIGKATLTYTTSVPPVAAAALAGPGCDRSYPAYRLADGGALVVFPIFQRLVLTTGAHGTFPQPGNRQSPFPLLPGGSYSEVTSLQADVCVAIVPPAGSGEPIQVIGQGLEPLSQTGVEGGIITT
jgi:hypothetical protein